MMKYNHLHSKLMSEYIDHIQNEKTLPITYSINIKTISTTEQPLTCYITAKPYKKNQLNYLKPSKCLENKQQSSIQLPVTYSTSIHVPCQPPATTQISPKILSKQSSSSHHHHHSYHYHHHYYHHYRQSSTKIKNKFSPQSPVSITSTHPATTSTTTITSPESSLSPSKKINQTISTSRLPNKGISSPPPHPPVPSYSTLVWNWFHQTPPSKTQPHHKGSQSDYSEICRQEKPTKRSLLFKLFTSPNEKQLKSKHHHRPCFTRKRFQSSSSLPSKSNNNYNE